MAARMYHDPEDLMLVRVSPRWLLLAVLLGFAFLPATLRGQESLPDGTELTISPADRILTLATFWSEAKYNFAFWDRVPELDWDAAFAQYCEEALNVESDIQFFRLANEFEEIVPQLRARARGIIVDVRLNGGGNSAYGNQIGSYFTELPVSVMTWTSPKHVAAHKAWGSRQDESGEYRAYGDGRATIEPQVIMLDPAQGPALSVPTVLLQSAYTYSAAENFVLLMQQMPQVTTMGTTTAGSTGQPLILRLPHGIFAGITTKRDLTPEGEDFVGVGLAPHVEVIDSPGSIAVGRDLPLERAVEHLLRVRR